MQTWDPQTYCRNGAFVPALGNAVLEWLHPRPGEEILDLGCGDGQLTLRIAEAGARVRGVDASPQMAAAARARGLQVDEASAEALPYADQQFQAVFSNAALHWVRDHDAMLAEVRRVLRAGGRFVAEMGGHGNIAAVRVAFHAALQRHELGQNKGDTNYYPAPDVYSRRLENSGFTVERMELIPRPTPLPASGMAGWLRTFQAGALEAIPPELRELVIQDTVELLEPVLRDADGNWVADYVRLRFIARA
ncbi:MAG TPA: class I SAM-dependent methyltransferase [Terracidiphilus sp.]|nr:class I SAM-dependent methyltransferase [Terracidiphilus sp.]